MTELRFRLIFFLSLHLKLFSLLLSVNSTDLQYTVQKPGISFYSSLITSLEASLTLLVLLLPCFLHRLSSSSLFTS